MHTEGARCVLLPRVRGGHACRKERRGMPHAAAMYCSRELRRRALDTPQAAGTPIWAVGDGECGRLWLTHMALGACTPTAYDRVLQLPRFRRSRAATACPEGSRTTVTAPKHTCTDARTHAHERRTEADPHPCRMPLRGCLAERWRASSGPLWACMMQPPAGRASLHTSQQRGNAVQPLVDEHFRNVSRGMARSLAAETQTRQMWSRMPVCSDRTATLLTCLCERMRMREEVCIGQLAHQPTLVPCSDSIVPHIAT
eukprot:358478-Chlamydomonas_euryale.AAC.7